ncbi:MAG: YgfZ/GcvT domain-containing protein [Actinomycetota bacterium]
MASFFDLSRRGKLSFSGPQALWFLDQLVTNKVVDLAAGAGAEALLLTPKGRIEAQMRILQPVSEQVFVDLDTIEAGPVADFFNGRVFATKVKVSDATADFGIIRLLGLDSAGLLERVIQLREVPDAEHECASFPEGFVAALVRPAPGFDVWTQEGFTGEFVRRLEAAGASALTGAEYEDVRVAGGVPVYGTDYDDTFLPQEAAMELAVHFQKGCYLGQEAVAMAQRGKIKRRLRHVIFDGPGGTGPMMYGQQNAGSVTSAGSFEGRWFGIATVKTEVLPGEAISVRVGDNAYAGITRELPGTTHGPKVPSARELRERLRGSA